MFKKFLLSLVCLLFIFLSGCSSSKQIDVASLAETVTADIKDGSLCYTFYIIGSDEKVDSVSVFANSFNQACSIAKKSYIPNLSLAKFELFVVNKKIYKEILKSDIEYISSEYYISPLSYVALCDDNTMKFFSETKDAPKVAEEHILLLKNKNKSVNINSLSIFNNFSSAYDREFYIPFINSNEELKAEAIKINSKK